MLIPLKFLVEKYRLNINGISHFGAHLGQEIKSYLDCGIKNIHLFEPQAEIFEALVENFKEFDLNFYKFGLGSESTIATLNSEKQNEGKSASVLNPLIHKELYPEIVFDKEEQIEIKVYDSLKIKNVNFLNLDIQGFELEALKGCKEALKNVDYIYTEVNRDYLYENSCLITDLDKYLSLYNFIRTETKWGKDGLLPWGDAFYIKENKISLVKKILFKSKNSINTKNIYFKILVFYINLKLLVKKILS